MPEDKKKKVANSPSVKNANPNADYNSYNNAYGSRYYKKPVYNSYNDYDPYRDNRYNVEASAKQEPKPYESRYKEYKNPFEPKDRRKKSKFKPILYGSIIAFCTIVIAILAFFMMPQLANILWKDFDNYAFVSGQIIKYDAKNISEFKRYKSYMDRDTIFPGVYIDGVHVGDMTRDQAEQMLIRGDDGISKTFSVTVSIGDKTWVIDSKNVEVTRNLGNVIDKAMSIGRANTTEISGTRVTPLQQRFDKAVKLRQEGEVLYTDWTYNQNTVRELTDSIVAYINRSPINSQIESFDFINREFKFTEDSPGIEIDGDELFNKVKEQIDVWANGAVVSVEPQIVLADVRKVDMMNNFKMISAYTTNTTSDKDRNNNIDLSCRAINGTVLLPGQQFSFNDVVGKRTIDKGYKEAGAISKGQSIQDIGGGVCQVSTTLFNAAARADLQIVKRNNHAWPITYISIGEDASVNWPNLDLVFKNDKDTPVFIVMYYSKKKCSAEIYGMTLGDGVSIDLESKVIKKSEPPLEPAYVLNTSLPIGTEKETIKSRTGYMVDTYKVWFKNGKEIKREKLHSTTYKPYQRTIEYNDGSAN
ncbi:MAG: hypothetical protein GYA87_06305 [Christensenellaceae bacterium]|nr:hypothetical protein [Christensenellaceae bacterium]